MTVVTAFAVSWNPLMNSNANATVSATNRKISGEVGSVARASQNDGMGRTGEVGAAGVAAGVLTGLFERPAFRHERG
jgi:hypothetical protein